MKKISKEELMKQMNLTEEEMEKVTGGTPMTIWLAAKSARQDMEKK